MENDKIYKHIRDNFKDVLLKNNENHLLQVFIDNIKVDFIGANQVLVKSIIKEDGLKLLHKNDIAGMKLNVINETSGRKNAKDFFDIACLLNDISLENMFDIYKEKYNKKEIYNVRNDLLYVEKILPFEWDNIKLLNAKIKPEDTPSIIKNAIVDYNKKNNLTLNMKMPPFNPANKI